MEAGDPFSIIRRFWAANNILQNPEDMREWETLPSDVMDHVLAAMDKRSMAAMRLVCQAWTTCVNRSVSDLQLSIWPPRPAFLSAFTSLESLSLHGPAVAANQQHIDAITPLLLSLAALPKLQDLSLTHAGPGCLENLEVLTGLTSLAINRPHTSMYTNRSSTAGDEQDGNVDADADADAAAAAGAGAAGGVPNWVLPGAAEDDDVPLVAAAGDMADAPGGYAALAAVAAAAAAAIAPAEQAASSSSSSDDAGLPASMVKLQQLQKLVLESVNPDVAVLSRLKELRRLELRGRTPRLREGLLVAANPLPGVGALTGLTCLIARCNYGISRLPPDIGALQGLLHLDVSKNMLWGLPSQVTQLSSLQYLDLSSNCMSVLPEEISALQSLTYLDVSNNSRVALPNGLSRLTKLVQLNLSWIWSDLTVLWEGSAGFSSLQALNVVGNGVAQLPPSIGGFKALTQLSLSMNNLSALPDQIGAISSLGVLELSDNRLAALPASIGRLSKLSCLSLRSNCLAALPKDVGKLSSLSYLDISMNHVAALPDSMTCLTCLSQLALSMNPLQSLPSGLSALQNLKILEMYYVRLTEGSTAGDSGLSKLQELIPGLYVFSNTMFPYDNPEDNAVTELQQRGATAAAAHAAVVDAAAAAAAAAVDGSVLQHQQQRSAGGAISLSPQSSSCSVATTVGSSAAGRYASSSSEASTSSGRSSSRVAFGGASSESSFGNVFLGPWPELMAGVVAAAAAGTAGGLFGLAAASEEPSGCVESEADDTGSWLDEADIFPDEITAARDQGPPAAAIASGSSSSSSSRSRLRATFAPEVSSPTAAAAASATASGSSDSSRAGFSSSSSSSNRMNWCQHGAASGGSWPSLAAAAAGASGGTIAQPGYLQGTWSCDLGLLAAATAAANASAAAASGAEQHDMLMPLRPLSKAHSVGRPLLSRYSRGGEPTNSPTGSSGYGLAARLLGAHPSSSTAVAADRVLPAATAAGEASEVAGSSAGGRPLRRLTAYGE